MNFLNPFDLLELETADSEAIKKAKKLKLADIELNDGFLEWGHQKISKSDFIKLIDELDDTKKKTFYLFIKKDSHLNNFLLNSDISFFYFYQSRKAYQNQDFIDFVSPYFSESFNVLLLKAFKSGNATIVTKLFSVPILVNQEYTDKLYKNLSRLLNEELDKLNNISPNNENIHNIENNCKSIVNIELLNALPDYFQKQRNDIAMRLQNISVDVYNNLSNLSVSFNIISHALKIKVDGFTSIKLKESEQKLNELTEKQKQDEKDNLVFEKWLKILLEIKSIIENVENKSTEVRNILVKVQKIFSITDLNNLPDSFKEINQQVALLLRSLSVTIYNTFEDAILAADIIKHAQLIRVDSETNSILVDSHRQLQEIIQKNPNVKAKKESIAQPKPVTKARVDPAAKQEPENKSSGWLSIFVIVFFVLIALSMCQDKQVSTPPPVAVESEQPPNIAPVQSPPVNAESTTTVPQETINLPNGDKYIGEVKEGKPEGRGTYFTSGGITATGEFKNGMLEGLGTLTISNGNKYEVEFKNFQPAEEGKITYVNGNQYEGKWKKGTPEGQGRLTFANGDSYEGKFKNGFFDGQGTYTFANGQQYTGKWKNGNPANNQSSQSPTTIETRRQSLENASYKRQQRAEAKKQAKVEAQKRREQAKAEARYEAQVRELADTQSAEGQAREQVEPQAARKQALDRKEAQIQAREQAAAQQAREVAESQAEDERNKKYMLDKEQRESQDARQRFNQF